MIILEFRVGNSDISSGSYRGTGFRCEDNRFWEEECVNVLIRVSGSAVRLGYAFVTIGRWLESDRLRSVDGRNSTLLRRCSRLFRRTQNKTTKDRIIASATPPTAAPTMAPVGTRIGFLFHFSYMISKGSIQTDDVEVWLDVGGFDSDFDAAAALCADDNEWIGVLDVEREVGLVERPGAPVFT